MERLILKNGLKVITYRMPNTHSVTLGLYIKSGVGYGNESFPGITHLLEHLHFRRMNELSQKELYYKMESLGSTLCAATYRDFMKFSMKVIPENMDAALDIFLNLLNAFEWTEAEFQKEKEVVLNQIMEKEQFISIEQLVRETVFGKHPLHNKIMGSAESVQAIQLEAIQTYKKQVFSSGNLLFCITGNVTDISYEDTVRKLEKVSVNKCRNDKRIEYPVNFHHRKPDIYFKSIKGEKLLDVNLSFDISFDKESRDILTLLNAILGEGVGSWLQKLVREDKCYTSNIYSEIEWYKAFAVLHIFFSVDSTRFLSCLESITYLLTKMKRAITRKDLDVTLPFYTSNQIFLEDDTEKMNFQLAYQEYILGHGYEKMTLQNNQNTIIKLQEYAREIFIKENLSFVVVGDVGRISKKEIISIFKKL